MSVQSSDRFIASCRSWSDFWDRAIKHSTAEKGVAFERLTQLYLQTAPEYRTKLQNVWLLRDVPPNIRRRLNLPAADEGIDLIARTRTGEYWAIQSKFRSQRDKLTRRELGTFTSLVFNTCNNIALAVVSHTATKPVSKRHLMRNTVEIGLDRWQSLNAEAWILIVGRLKGESARPKPRNPMPHQRAAVFAAKAHFVRQHATRGRLIMPCGTGKSLTAHWIAQALGAKTILVAVPSLALIRQSVTDWTREFLAPDHVPDWICVCSDETVGNLERDEFVGEVYELGLPTHTAPKEIAALLRAPSKGSKIVFTTYQSSDKLAAAARRARFRFDLAILDEAHKTVGVRSKRFATLLRDNSIKVRHRLYMTATERVLRGRNDDVLSMDNEKDYGKCFFQMSYKEAISQRIISDYKILTMTVGDDRIRQLIAENRILNLNLRNLDEAEAQSAAAGIALKQVFKKQKIKHAISFHRSIRGADRFREQQDAFNRIRDIGPRTINLHISSKKTAGERSDLLREFVKHRRSLMTNARCLTEGVDVRAIDCVLFADPKQSRIDIVQAAGRALRRHQSKEYGYILLPLVVPSKMEFSKFAETTAFRQIANTITALSIQDERIAEEFRALENGRVSSGKLVEIEGDIPVGMKMKLADFSAAISTRVWQNVGRANWRPFQDAREYARRLGLKSTKQWHEYSKSGERPPDIPAFPGMIYANDGWAGMGDWLGTSFLPFKKAREFVRKLGLVSNKQWRDYFKSGTKPDNIPSGPEHVYKTSGWAGYGDWLGTGRPSRIRPLRSFKAARTFVRRLGLKSNKAWLIYCRTGKKPNDIPTRPDGAYAKTGWAGLDDWLGTGRVSPSSVSKRSFEDARSFVRRLGLKSNKEWFAYCRSGKKPNDIPTEPRYYKGAGWAGFHDWLGITGWRAYKQARAFVHGLALKSTAEWNDYCRSGKKPADIPASPAKVYANEGWAGMGDWLGTGTIAMALRQYRSFTNARAFARGLGLKSEAEWKAYCKSGKKPADIPAIPDNGYKNNGWAGYVDWLGSGKYSRNYRSFKQARAFVRSLNLKSSSAWLDYCKSGKRPTDIPSNPNTTYAKTGWTGYPDWLGYSSDR